MADKKQPDDMDPQGIADDVEKWLKGEPTSQELAETARREQEEAAQAAELNAIDIQAQADTAKLKAEQEREAAKRKADEDRAAAVAKLVSDFDGRGYEVYPTPGDENFKTYDTEECTTFRDYVMAHGLEPFVTHLLRKYPAKFSHLASVKIELLWKRSGGSPKGQPKYGEVVKAPPVLAAYQEEPIDWIIWIAADHARINQWTRRQMEAAIFHQLSHLTINVEKGVIEVTAHDIEGFIDEIEIYGDKGINGEAFNQLAGLPLFRGMTA